MTKRREPGRFTALLAECLGKKLIFEEKHALPIEKKGITAIMFYILCLVLAKMRSVPCALTIRSIWTGAPLRTLWLIPISTGSVGCTTTYCPTPGSPGCLTNMPEKEHPSAKHGQLWPGWLRGTRRTAFTFYLSGMRISTTRPSAVISILWNGKDPMVRFGSVF